MVEKETWRKRSGCSRYHSRLGCLRQPVCRQKPENSDTLPLTGKSARMGVIQTVGRLKLSESQHSENRPCQEHQQWLVWQRLQLMYGVGTVTPDTVGPEAEAQPTQSGCGLAGRLGKPA